MKNYFIKIIDLFAKAEISKPLQIEFNRWLTSEKFSTEKDLALRELWKNLTVEASNETERSLDEVRTKIGKNKINRRTKALRSWQAAAAILTAALLSTLYLTTGRVRPDTNLIEQYVPTAETAHITLPDGSLVQMNSTSTLLYPGKFSGKNRSVYLIGEANFKVAKNKKKPFVVKSNDFQITALGTEFNVTAYPGDSTMTASLISGSVEVKFDNMSATRVLKPNDQLAYNRFTKKSLLDQPNMNDVTAWQRGELVFRGTTLKEIITVLERKYPYSFVYAMNTLRGDKYTFRFKDKAPLPEVMDIIVRVSGNVKYWIEGSKCHILPS